MLTCKDACAGYETIQWKDKVRRTQCSSGKQFAGVRLDERRRTALSRG
jgi:hypothetical protein